MLILLIINSSVYYRNDLCFSKGLKENKHSKHHTERPIMASKAKASGGEGDKILSKGRAESLGGAKAGTATATP